MSVQYKYREQSYTLPYDDLHAVANLFRAHGWISEDDEDRIHEKLNDILVTPRNPAVALHWKPVQR